MKTLEDYGIVKSRCLICGKDFHDSWRFADLETSKYCSLKCYKESKQLRAASG